MRIQYVAVDVPVMTKRHVRMLQTARKTVEVQQIDRVDASVIINGHTITDLLDQAQAELDDARHAESNSCVLLTAFS